MAHKSCLNLKVFMFSAILFLMHGCVSMNQYGSIIPVRSTGDVLTIEEIINEKQNQNLPVMSLEEFEAIADFGDEMSY